MEDFILTDENALGDTAIFACDKTAFYVRRKFRHSGIKNISLGTIGAQRQRGHYVGFSYETGGQHIRFIIERQNTFNRNMCEGLPKNLPSAKRELIEWGHLLLESPFIREKCTKQKRKHMRATYLYYFNLQKSLSATPPQGRLCSDIKKRE